MRAALARPPPVMQPIAVEQDAAVPAMPPPQSASPAPASPSTPAPLTAAALADMEAAARAQLAALALERESHLLLAVQFLRAAQAGLAHTAARISSMQAERHAAEATLIGAETQCSALQETTHRVEETRRFLVNRVKCAQWEKKSHFHLTAIDHMLGNVQPALFDVATMLRGHLRICAVARASMVAHQRSQGVIHTHQHTKEQAFESMKQLLLFLEHAQARCLELRHLAAEVLRKLGPDLERFIERKRRARRSTPASSAQPSPAMLMRGSGSLSPPLGLSNTHAVSLALAAAAPAPPSLASTALPARWSDTASLDAELSQQGMGHGSFNVLGLGSEEGHVGWDAELASLAQRDLTVSQAGEAQGQGGLMAVARSMAQQDAANDAAAASSAFPSSSSSSSSSRFQLSVAPPSASSPSPDSSPLSSSVMSSPEEQSFDLSGERERGPMASPIELQLPSPAGSPSPQSSPFHHTTASASASNTLSVPVSSSSSSSSASSSSHSSKSKSLPPSPPSPLAWPALGSAPPGAPSMLLAAAVEASEDVWPLSLDALAAEHVESLSHPVQHGHSSLSMTEEHAGATTGLQIIRSPPPRRKSSAGASPGTSPRSSSSLPSSPPSTPPSAILGDASSSSAGPSPSHSPPAGATSAAPSGIGASLAAAAAAASSSSGTPAASASASAATPASSSAAPASSSAAATAASATARQGYIAIKMRYYAQLGQVKQSTSITPHAPPLSTSPMNSAALALALPIGGGLGRRKGRGESPLSPTGGGAMNAPPSSPSSPSTPPSPSASAMYGEPVLSPPSSPSSPSAIRSRAVLARMEDDSTSSPNKRWMLRPLPANIGPGMSTPPSSPAPPDSPTQSPRSSPTTRGLSSAAATAAAAAPAAKKSWWRGLFSSSKSKSARAEEEKRDKGASKEQQDGARNGLVPGGGSGGRISSVSATPTTPGRFAPSNSASASPIAGSDEPLPPLPPHEPRILASDWAALASLLDAIEGTNEKQQRAWEVLESVLDKRERVQAEERAAARIAAQKEAEEAARRLVEEEVQREAQEAEAAAVAAAVAAARAVPQPLPVSVSAIPSHGMASSPVVPTPNGADSILSSSPKHVHSSHSSVTSSSALLLATAGSALHSTGADSGTSVMPVSLAPMVDASPVSSTVGASAVRSQRIMSVSSVLQGVPAPTLMPADVRLDGVPGDGRTQGEASSPIGCASDSSSLLPSLPALSVSPRAATAPALSRSLPTTPTSASLTSHHVTSFSTSAVSSSATGASVSTSSMPVRRASDSAALSLSSASARPRSSPPAVLRSNSFTLALAHHVAMASQAASHARSHSSSFSHATDWDASDDLLAQVDRARQLRQHSSPPSPSSLVC